MVHALKILGTRLETVVGAGDKVARPRPQPRMGTLVASTPLDAIARLELARDEIGTVILTGAAETDRALAAFLAEAYPCLRVVAGLAEDLADCYLPAFA
jgi:hypothetical protein